jgi:CheY-like chemotaxis protein
MNHRRLNVLFADPESDWQSTAESVLGPIGVTAICVRTGQEALSRMDGGEVHVAVLDQNMPQLSGLQVVKLSRKRESAPPSILLTREMTPQFLQEALLMHVFSVLSKPVDPNLLLETLARVIRRHYAGYWPEQA